MKKIITSLLAFLLAFTSLSYSSISADGSASSNGKLKVNVPSYNAEEGWTAGELKVLNIDTKFTEDASIKKQVRVKLPEGIRYDKIPMRSKEEFVDPKVDITTVWSQNYVESVVHPVMHPEYDSYNNELIYTLNSTVNSLLLDNISISVDMNVYYGPKEFKHSEGNGIEVQILENDVVTAETSMDIKAPTVTPIIFWTSYDVNSQYFPEDGALHNSERYDIYRSGAGHTLPFYLKSGYVETSYPDQMVVKGNTPGFIMGTSVIDTENQVVKTTFDSYYYKLKNSIGTVYRGGALSFEVPDSAQVSEKNESGNYIPYYSPKTLKAIVETYDGTLIEVNSQVKIKHIVLDPMDPEAQNEKLNVGARSTYYDDTYEQVDGKDFKIIGNNFVITNNDGIVKKNQWVEYTIGKNYLVDEISFTVSSSEPKPDVIYYKTNFDDGDTPLREATGSQIKKGAQHDIVVGYLINRDTLNLQNGEYLVYAKAFIGDISGAIASPTFYNQRATLYAFGKLIDDPSVTKVNISLKTWSDDGAGGILPYSENNQYAQIHRSKGGFRPIFQSNTSVSGNGSIEAGGATEGSEGQTKLRINTTISSNNFAYSNGPTVLQNPIFYIRIPAFADDAQSITSGLKLVEDSIKISQKSNTDLEYTISDPYFSSVDGSTVYKVTTKKLAYGTYIGEKYNTEDNSKFLNSIAIVFELEASIMGSGTYNLEDMIFIDNKDGKNLYAISGQNSSVADKFDVRNNGEKKTISRVNNKAISVTSKKTLLIDTYFKKSDDSFREPVYNPAIENAVDFTAGAEASYYVDVMNNSGVEMNSMTTWVPSPKTGNYYGDLIHGVGGEPFKWDMTIIPVYETEVYVRNDQGAIVKLDDNDPKKAEIEAKYEVKYSMNAVDSDFESANFDQTAPNGDTTMIRIVNTGGMADGERIVYKFTYLIAETNETIKEDPDKLLSINAFRPFYRFSSATVSASQSGTLVGVRLEMAEIKGVLFNDVNQNGIYDEGDSPLSEVEVIGQRLDKDTKLPVGDPIKTLSGTDGTYKLDVSVGLFRINFNDALDLYEDEGLKYFTVVNKGTDITVDSDAAITTSGDKILGTALVSSSDELNVRNINAGLVKYDGIVRSEVIEPITLIKPIPSVTAESKYKKDVTLTPTNLVGRELIDLPTVVWSSSDANIASVTVDATDKLKAQIVAIKEGTAVVTLTFDDIYGNTQTFTYNVTVDPNTIPEFVIPNATITFEAKENIAANKITKWTDVFVGLEANDAQDGDLTDKIVYSVNSQNIDVSKPASYVITIQVTDKDGNSASETITFVISDSTKPTVDVVNDHLYILQPKTTSTETVLSTWVETNGGITFSDIVTKNADLTVDYADLNLVDVNTTGDYTVTLNVTDEAGNVQSKPLTITVVPYLSADAEITVLPTEVANADWAVLSSAEGFKVTPTTSTKYTQYTVDASNVSETPGNYVLTITTEDGQSVDVDVIVAGALVENYDLYVNINDAKNKQWIIDTAVITTIPTGGTIELSPATVDYTVAGTTDITVTVKFGPQSSVVNGKIKVHVLPSLVAGDVVVDVDAVGTATFAQQILTDSEAVSFDTSNPIVKAEYPRTLAAGYTVDTSAVLAADGTYPVTITSPNGEVVIIQVTVTEDLTITSQSPVYTRTGVTRDDQWLIDSAKMKWTPKANTPVITGTVDYTTAGTYTKNAEISKGSDSKDIDISLIVMDNMKPTVMSLIVNADDVATLDLVSAVGIKAYDLSNPLVAAETPVTYTGTILPQEGSYTVVFKAADNTDVSYVVEVVENITVSADYDNLYIRQGASIDDAWILSEAGIHHTPSSITPVVIGTVDTTVAGATDVKVVVKKSELDFKEVTITVNVVPTISSEAFTIASKDVASLDVAKLVALSKTKATIIVSTHEARTATSADFTLGGQTVGVVEGIYHPTLSTTQESATIAVTVVEDLDIQITNAHLFAKVGDIKDAAWLESNAIIVTGPATAVLSIDDSAVNYSVAGSYTVNVVLKRADNSASISDSITVEVVPAIQGTTTLNIFIDDLASMNDQDIINVVNPIAWDVTNPLQKVAVTSFSIQETVLNQVGTQTLTIVASNGETLTVTLNVQEHAVPLEFEVTNTTLFVKEGESVTNDWVRTNAVVSLSPSNATLTFSGTVDTSVAGTYPVSIKASHNGEEATEIVNVVVVPRMTVNNASVIVLLSELSAEKVIESTNPSAWNVTPLTSTAVSTFSVENLPSVSGTHDGVVVRASNGEFVVVRVVVVNDIGSITEYTISANDIRVNIHDLEQADFIALSNAQGTRITRNSDGDIIQTADEAVRIISIKPTTVGTYKVQLQAGNAITEIEVVVFDDGMLELRANDVTLTWKEFSTLDQAGLEALLLTKSNAKIVNTTTNEEYASQSIKVKVINFLGITAPGEYNVELEYTLDQSTLTRGVENTNTVEFRRLIKLTIVDETVNPIIPPVEEKPGNNTNGGETSKPGDNNSLPLTGYQESTLTIAVLLIGFGLFISYIGKRKKA